MDSDKDKGKATMYLVMVVCVVVGVAMITRSLGWTLIAIPAAFIGIRQCMAD